MNDAKPAKSSWAAQILRFARLFVFSAAAIVTLTALAYSIENWRGERAWRRAVEEHIANGDPIYLFPTGSASSSGASDPAAKSIYKNVALPQPPEPKESRPRKGVIPSVRNRAPEFGRKPNGRTDLEAWQKLFRETPGFPVPQNPGSPAEDVLLALSRWDSDLQELDATTRKPDFEFRLAKVASGIPFAPHLAFVKRIGNVLNLRAEARLAVGKTADALADTEFAERLANAPADVPMLIGALVAVSTELRTTHSVWEGLVDHRWNDQQLARLQELFAARDPRKAILSAFAGERYLNILGAEHLLEEAGRFWDDRRDWPDFPDQRRNLLSIATGRGWIRQNQVTLAGRFDQARQGEDAWSRQTNLNQWSASKPVFDLFKEVGNDRPLPYRFLADRSLPVWGARVTMKADRLLTVSRMAIVACALERYRIANGSYPESLKDLRPPLLGDLDRLPLDPFSGKSFAYERLDDDGSYTLASAGPSPRYLGESSLRSDTDWDWPMPIVSMGIRRLF